MISLTVRALTELLDFIVDNRGRTCPVAESGVPLIATNCLKEGKREPVFENVRFVDDETYKTWFRAHPEPRDIIFVCKGSPGRVAVTPDPVSFCIAQDMVALRAKRSVVDPSYLYYRLRVKDVRARIENMHVGTMIPHFKKGDFGKLRFSVHDGLAAQRAIAEVLGALDDKITANDRIISSAERLMVTKAATTSTRIALAEIATHSTAALKPHEFDPQLLHFSLPAFDEGTVPALEDRDSVKSNKFRIDSPCVLMSKLNPRIPRIWHVGHVPSRMAVASTEFVVLIPNGFDAAVLWAVLNQPPIWTELAGKVAGTSGSHQRVRPAEMLSLQVGDPRTLQEDVRGAISELGRLCDLRRTESSILTTTRDELLPLLMSGRVRVKDVEEVV